MAYLFFIDESGQYHRNSPYEVLAGVVIRDTALWPLIQQIDGVEKKYFGNFYSPESNELKAKKLLKTKVFRLAEQLPKISKERLPELSQACLQSGSNVNKINLTALAQAKLLYTQEVLQLCLNAGCKVCASIINESQQMEFEDLSRMSFLRKDYAYLFERFYYFLEDTTDNEMGIVVFDELDKSKSHILHDQMAEYFLKTNKGQLRSSQIIPEPFFVHSELTTGVHIADLIAYILSWGFRTGGLEKPKREELDPWVDMVCKMRYRAMRVIPEIKEEPVGIWSIAII